MTGPQFLIGSLVYVCVFLRMIVAIAAGSENTLSASDFRNAGLRGFDVGANFGLSDRDLSDMRSLGANVARVLIVVTRTSSSGYSLPPASLAAIDRYAALGRQLGFRIVIGLEPLPKEWEQEYWADAGLKQSILSVWRQISEHYRDDPAIAGYDLLNEPIATTNGSHAEAFSAAGARMWMDFATQIIDTIRSVDPTHAIIIEPSPGAVPLAFKYIDKPIPRPNLIYSVHMYEPHRLTHQGIYHPEALVYPGQSSSLGVWGREEMAASLAPVREFAARTNLPIFVGEFSIVRWAPEASPIRYLTDLLRIINDNEGWSWAYHAWRECECWDAEIPSSFFYNYPYALGKPQLPSAINISKYRFQRTDAIILLEAYLGKMR